MKTLTQHLNEKLIVNKNYKNVDDIESLFDNIKFKHLNKYYTHTLFTSVDIFSIMVDYIRDYNVRRFSDFDSYRKIGVEDRNACLAVFNKRIKEFLIFQKKSNEMYKCLLIDKNGETDPYQFERFESHLVEMYVLKDVDMWTNINDVEYYEISEETFEGVSKLYDKLVKK